MRRRNRIILQRIFYDADFTFANINKIIRLRLSVRVCIANSVVSAANEVLVESTALFYCYFQNSKLSLIEFQYIG